MSFDYTLRRLITGGRDGTVKIWNFHNGDCLRVMKTGGNTEVCEKCVYIISASVSSVPQYPQYLSIVSTSVSSVPQYPARFAPVGLLQLISGAVSYWKIVL